MNHDSASQTAVLNTTNTIGTLADLDAVRACLQGMSDVELLAFGKQMHELCYPLTYVGDGKPSVPAFSIQLDEAQAEWRRRHPLGNRKA